MTLSQIKVVANGAKYFLCKTRSHSLENLATKVSESKRLAAAY